jgi:hypothetical protein
MISVLSIVVTFSSFYGVFPYRRAVFPCRQVVLPQFWLPRRGSTPQIRVWGSFWFLLLFLRCIVTVLICNHWRFSGRVCSVVGASVFCHYNFPLWCSSFSPLQLTRPHHFVASLFALFSSLHSRRPSLCITFSPTLSLNMESLS